MLPLVIGAALAFVVIIVVGVLPYHVFRVASRNVYRIDGTLSYGRCRREVRHLTSLLGQMLVLVTTGLGSVVFGLVVVDQYVVPLPMVSEMVSQFDSNPVQWEYNIEHGIYGDLGEQYEAWSHSRGFSTSSARFWQEFLWLQWGAIAIVGMVLIFRGFRFLARWHNAAVLAYARKVLARSKEYQVRDRKALVKAYARRAFMPRGTTESDLANTTGSSSPG